MFKGRAFRAIHPLEEEQGDHKGSTNDELKQRDAQEKGTACPEWNAERETKNAREKREELRQLAYTHARFVAIVHAGEQRVDVVHVVVGMLSFGV